MTDDTVSPAQGATPHEPSQVNLRADLSHEIATAQSALTAQLADLESLGNSPLLEELRGQLKILNALSEMLPHAKGGTLSQIRAEVATSVAAARSVAGQAQAIAASTKAHEAELATLHEASEEARKATEDFVHSYYEKRIFEPYLHFDTAEDERAFREREAERERAIRTAHAEKTPEGDLRALDLQLEQLNDAGKNGAADSPDFQSTQDRLKATRSALSSALKSSPATNPAKPTDVVALSEPSPAAPIDPAILAALKAAGVALADQTQQGHGVTQDLSASNSPYLA